MVGCGLIMLDKFRGMNLISGFPCIVAFRVPFPFNEILEFLQSSELSVCDDSFNFILVFSVNKVRWWPGEVRAMGSCFMVRR